MLAISNAFIASLLPKNLIQAIENEKLNEKSVLALSTLISNVVLGAAKSLERAELKKLDPNPGDGGCQMRGYLLFHYFSDSALKSEATELKQKMESIKEIVNRRNAIVSTKKNTIQMTSPSLFFKEQFANTACSKKMEFIFQCYLLAITRQPYQTLPNGIVLTKSESSLLSKLSNQISLIDSDSRRKIIEVAQAAVSASSIDLLREEAEKLTCVDLTFKEHLMYMLSSEMLRQYTPDVKYEPKTFGCLFYEYQAILYCLRQQQALVCFQSIAPKGIKPFQVLLRPQSEGAEFSIIDDEIYKNYSQQLAIVVFEGVVSSRYNRESFSQKVSDYGFTELILSLAAIEAPYERTSTLSSIADTQAKEQIAFYRNLAESFECQKASKEPFLILDHVYCASLVELERQR